MKLQQGNSERSDKLEDYSQQVGYEFRNMHQYISASSKLFDENRQELTNQKQEAIKAMKDYDPTDVQVEAHQYDVEIEYYDRFRNVMMNNAFVGAISLFEVLLKNLCEIFVIESQIAPDEINARSYTEKSMKFLTKVVGVDLPENDDRWTSIRMHIDLRNIIVHQNSTVQKTPNRPVPEQPKDYRRVVAFPGVQIVYESETYAFFAVENSDVIVNFCDLAEGYLEDVVGKLWKLLDK